MFKSVYKIVRAKAFSEALVKGQQKSRLCPPCQEQAQQGTVWGWQSLKEVRVPIPGKLAFLSEETGVMGPKAALCWVPCTLLDQLPADFAPLYDGVLLTRSYFSPTNCL